MAQTAQLQAQPRQQLGSRANRRLRQTGALPGVIYGHQQAVVPISLPRKELTSFLERGAHLFDLNLEGTSEKVLVKEIQYDHLGKEIIHVDFSRVSLDERVKVTVALQLKGEPVGEKEGGVLQQVITELEIECLVTEIPDVINQDISNLGLDQEIRIRDLQLPAGVKVLQDPDLLVCSIHLVKEEEPVEAEAAATEPELVGKAKEGEEEEAEAEGAKK